jgi:hypothetical protein
MGRPTALSDQRQLSKRKQHSPTNKSLSLLLARLLQNYKNRENLARSSFEIRAEAAFFMPRLKVLVVT